MKIIKRNPATMNHVWPSNQVLNLQGNPWNCSCPLLEVTESAAPPDGNFFPELYLHRIIIIVKELI